MTDNSGRVMAALLLAAGLVVSGCASNPAGEDGDSGEAGTGATGGSSQSGGTGGTSNQSGTGGTGTPEIPAGPAVACSMTYPATVAVAVLVEAIGTSPAPQHSVTFYEGGSMRTVGDLDCAPTGMTLTSADTCSEDYACGPCKMKLYAPLPSGSSTPYFGLDSFEKNADCESFRAFYRLMDPKDAAGGGGIRMNAPVPGNATSDPCGDCLSACQGSDSCCTGTGCTCQGACEPTGCVGGLSLCCGFGGCICTDNCPY
jgi:hypothetical protein